jgi:hypothetical protein
MADHASVPSVIAHLARNVKLPSAYRIEWAGSSTSLHNAKQRLAVIVPVTLVLIVVLLYGLFKFRRAILPTLFSAHVVSKFITGRLRQACARALQRASCGHFTMGALKVGCVD